MAANLLEPAYLLEQTQVQIPPARMSRSLFYQQIIGKSTVGAPCEARQQT